LALRASECTVRRLEKVLFAPDACKASQAKQRLSVLRAVFAEAVRLDVVEANPAREVQVDQYKSQAVDDRGEPRMFTPDEVDRLLAISRAFDATPHRGAKRSLRTYPLLAVLLGSGLRMGEALALRWSSFDPARSRLVVERSITITMSSRMVEKKPKSRQGERSVSIPRWTRDALIEYLGEQDQRFVGRDDLMFPNRDGRYLNPHNARRTLRKMCEGTELEGLPPAQTSRRTVGTAIDRTHGSEAAAAHLGNSRVVALSYYIANDKERPDFSSALEAIGPGRVREEPPQNVDPEWD